ncbi:MAG: vitamin K epoxide reductase family protein [Wenzhouxiangellaceae bacterium]|nr:vitamin K epoxide reductase family protein [Wenzhouxiangellaceae bacterium]
MSRKRKPASRTAALASPRKAAKSAGVSTSAVARHRLQPDVPVSVLAVIGLLISGYLGFFAHGAEAPLFCSAESGCGVIQQSTYAELLGIPTALWGFGLYALILWSATTLPPRLSRWRRLAWLSGLGCAISVYYTLTGIIALDATCGWCLASAVTMTMMFVTVLLRRPESAPGQPWGAFALNLFVVWALTTGALGAWQNGWLLPPENQELRALAEHLEESGAKYYGAFWCPNCQRQRQLFGRSADRLPYVECTPNGRGGMVAFECIAADISAYPTWVINGRRLQGVLTPEELSRHSGFAGVPGQ